MLIHELVAEQAGAAPDAVAVAGDKLLTYGELNRRAGRLARRLVSLGVRAEVPVALFLERSPELAIAALAVLKAGGAYVPLDPSYPPARIAMLLDDCRAPVVLTHSSVAEKLPAGKYQTVVLDGEEEIAEAGVEVPDDAAAQQITPENTAYVIFTSGSTGRPKGVQITHANLLNLVQWHQRAFHITAADRATLQASPGFDAAVCCWLASGTWRRLSATFCVQSVSCWLASRPGCSASSRASSDARAATSSTGSSSTRSRASSAASRAWKSAQSLRSGAVQPSSATASARGKAISATSRSVGMCSLQRFACTPMICALCSAGSEGGAGS